jgi:hypothetical protein
MLIWRRWVRQPSAPHTSSCVSQSGSLYRDACTHAVAPSPGGPVNTLSAEEGAEIGTKRAAKGAGDDASRSN